jgi:hypothetical protein
MKGGWTYSEEAKVALIKKKKKWKTKQMEPLFVQLVIFNEYFCYFILGQSFP